MVQVEVRSKGPLGYVVKISTTAGTKYDGLVYHNDIFETPPAVGDKTDAWVLKVRQDGKVDVTLRPPGAAAKISDGVERVMQALERQQNKSLKLGDKSSPKEIHAVLGLSKKVFKEALGHMYKRKMVALGPEEVRLQPIELWETGLLGTKEERSAHAKDQAEAAAAAAAKGAALSVARGGNTHKDGAQKKTKKTYGDYRALPVVPMPAATGVAAAAASAGAAKLAAHKAAAAAAAQGEETEDDTEEAAQAVQAARLQVQERRAVVEAALIEDVRFQKAQAQERLDKRAAAKLAHLKKLQLEHTQRMTSLSKQPQQVSDEEKEMRLALFTTAPPVKAKGLKATMERIKALKAGKNTRTAAPPPPPGTAPAATAGPAAAPGVTLISDKHADGTPRQEMRTAAETLATTPQPAAASSETLAMRKTTPAAASTTSGARSSAGGARDRSSMTRDEAWSAAAAAAAASSGAALGGDDEEKEDEVDYSRGFLEMRYDAAPVEHRRHDDDGMRLRGSAGALRGDLLRVGGTAPRWSQQPPMPQMPSAKAAAASRPSEMAAIAHAVERAVSAAAAPRAPATAKSYKSL